MRRRYGNVGYNDTDVTYGMAYHTWQRMLKDTKRGYTVCVEWRLFSKFSDWFNDQLYRGQGTVLWLRDGATDHNPSTCELLLPGEVAQRIELQRTDPKPREPRIIGGIAVNDAQYDTTQCPVYSRWSALIKRKVALCPEWLSFSNFREWYLAQPMRGRLRHDGTDQPYGPDSCTVADVLMVCDSKDRGVAYVAWRALRHRCYSSDSPAARTICTEWRTFSNFRQWFYDQRNAAGEYVVIYNGENVYSPENCKLVSRQQLERYKRPKGVAFGYFQCLKSHKWIVKMNNRTVGQFNTEAEALREFNARKIGLADK